MNRRLLPAAAIATLAFSMSLAAGTPGSEPAQSGPPRFQTGVELVGLDVCVKDRTGRLVSDLTADDFVVLEDGVPQRISLFAPGADVPMAVVLLVDQSSSMTGEKIALARAAAAGFVRALGPDDIVEVTGFNERANRRSPFSASRAEAEAAISSLMAGGQTGLFDALAVALSELRAVEKSSPTEYQQAIVLLSDGEDSSSVLEFEDVLDEARRSGVMIYTVSTPRSDDARQAPPRELARFANDTGGRAVGVANAAGLEAAYREIGTELRHLYRLAYAPANLTRDGSWRTISVRVSRPDARTWARAGYYRPRPTPAILTQPSTQ